MLRLRCKAQMELLRLLGALVLTFSTASALTQQTPDFSGIWMPDSARSGGWPQEPPYTAAGRAAVASFHENYPGKTYDPGSFCVFQGMPSTMFGGGYWIEIIQRPERTTVVFELSKPPRRVYTDSRPHPEDPFPTKNGHSIGHWEGSTLVIDTIGIATRVGPVPSSEATRIVERMSMELDGALVNEMTIYDPTIFMEPVTVDRYYTRWSDEELLEYECTDGPWRDYLLELDEQRAMNAQ